MKKTIKKFVLTLFGLCFLNFAIADENVNLQILNDTNATKNTQFEKIKTLEFPKDENEEKELNELFKAIEALDSNKIKTLIKQNPRLVNLQNKNLDDDRYLAPLYNSVLAYGEATNDKNRETALKNIKILLDNKADVNVYSHAKDTDIKASLFSTFFISDMLLDRKFEIIDFLIKNSNLNLQQAWLRSKEDEIYPLATIIVNFPMDYNSFELFNFFVKQKTNTRYALHNIIMQNLGKKIEKLISENNIDELEKYIQSKEYQNGYREKIKKYIYEIISNYTVDDFWLYEISIVGKYFVYTNDTEFIQLMIDNGYLKNKKLYEFMLKTATNVGTKEIINQIKGAKK